MDRIRAVEAVVDHVVATAAVPDGPAPAADAPLGLPDGPTVSEAVAALSDQLTSRALDVVARELRREGAGYYTISSAGHEDDVCLGALTRPSDPAFLHYRSGALFLARARRDGAEEQVVDDVLSSLLASRDDPAAKGRHKVWGSRLRWVVPQTSTIGSHLPKAVGAAIAIDRRRSVAVRAGAADDVPEDAIALVSFGDASLNHASAQTAINAARWSVAQGVPTPLLLVCEDNGLGISVTTPPGWVERSVGDLAHLTYVRARGELDEVWAATRHAVDTVRDRRRPVLLHLDTVRLWGHAGSDVEQAYRSRGAIEADESHDPIPRTLRQLLAAGAITREAAAELVAGRRRHVRDRATALIGTPGLRSREEVMAPLELPHPDRVRAEVADRPLDPDRRAELHPRGLPEEATAPAERTLAAVLRATLHDELLRRPETLVFGEDVAVKGGVYGITGGLRERYGTRRVFDTLLDETSILGLAQGAGLLGFLPIAEIQYLAYLHNALDQLRGEAGSTAFFSDGAFTTPMVVRIAGLAHQQGFGGHFHNDNAVAAIREIPGIALAVPSRPDDAAGLLRAACSLAATDGAVVVVLEPIGLYHQRDLHEPGDEAWLATSTPPDHLLLPGEVGIHGSGRDLAIVTYGNGLRLSLRAAARLATQGVAATVIDLRWLSPLPHDAVRAAVAEVGAVLVVDECRASGGVADAVVADLAESGVEVPLASIRAADSYVPLGPAADTVLVTEARIEAAARRLCDAGTITARPAPTRRRRWWRRR